MYWCCFTSIKKYPLSSITQLICPKEFLILSRRHWFPLPWYLYNKLSDPHSFDHLVPNHSELGIPPFSLPHPPARSTGTNREHWRLALLHKGWYITLKEPQLDDTIFGFLTAWPLMLTVHMLHFKSGPGPSHCCFPFVSCPIIPCS